jgi:hypothetical protein
MIGKTGFGRGGDRLELGESSTISQVSRTIQYPASYKS